MTRMALPYFPESFQVAGSGWMVGQFDCKNTPVVCHKLFPVALLQYAVLFCKSLQLIFQCSVYGHETIDVLKSVQHLCQAMYEVT